MRINACTREFNACIKVCKAVGIRIGISKLSTRMACTLDRNDYDRISISNNADDVVILQKMETTGQMLYMATLHFKGLNCTRYGVL